MTDPTTTLHRPEGRPPEAIRARSRAVYELALDRIEAKLNADDDLTASELAQIANTTGRLGLGGDDSPATALVVTVHRELSSIVDTKQLVTTTVPESGQNGTEPR